MSTKRKDDYCPYCEMEIFTCCEDAANIIRLMHHISIERSIDYCWCCGGALVDVKFYMTKRGKREVYDIKQLCPNHFSYLKEYCRNIYSGLDEWPHEKPCPYNHRSKCSKNPDKYIHEKDAKCKGKGGGHRMYEDKFTVLNVL